MEADEIKSGRGIQDRSLSVRFCALFFLHAAAMALAARSRINRHVKLIQISRYAVFARGSRSPVNRT